MTPDERERAIGSLLPLVRRIARRIQRVCAGSEVDDLVGDGCIGLVRAVDGFDPGRGVPLEQYARRLIVGAMLNGVRRLDPVPERVRRTLRLAEQLRYALAQELGTLPSLQTMEARHRALARARIAAHRAVPLSLDAPFPPGQRLEPDASGDPQAIHAARAERARVRAAIAALPARQRRVIVARYYAERPLRSLSGPMGVSAQRISQLHLAAMATLHDSLEESA